jgi:SAM-dependent methyltransferase
MITAPTTPRARSTVRLGLLRRFMEEAPFQPATNLWRAVELPVLATALPRDGWGLDVGCGDGVLTGILRDLVGARWQLVGLDPEPAETALAAGSGQYVRLHTVPADRIPEPDAAFDFAFANSVLEHIPNLPDCLPEIARCLKQGGLFAATVPSDRLHDCLAGPDWTRWLSRAEYLRETDRRIAHVNYWSPPRWSEELGRAGFEAVEARPYLSARQVRRWEVWANWTGGLLYRLKGGTTPPVGIQRQLNLRRPLPERLRPLAMPLARVLSRGVLADEARAGEPSGCLLVTARRR